MQQRERGALSALEKGGGARSCSPRELSEKQSLKKQPAGNPFHQRRGGGGQLTEQTNSKQSLQK
jgi:hypothetical protein